ncbi:MAG: sigma-70 family RNA polymerase sigma factor [Pirellulaceae bacterium]|nr:sigma-70 family RNA polymerase sigma factor [Pirellulaceae bacterium]
MSCQYSDQQWKDAAKIACREAKKYLYDKSMAKDVAQQALMEIFRKDQSYATNIFGLVARTASRRAIDANRRCLRHRVRNRKFFEHLTVAIEPSERTPSRHEELLRAIDLLPLDLHQIIDSIFFRGDSRHEAAKRYGISYDTVTRKYNAACDILRRIMSPENF